MILKKHLRIKHKSIIFIVMDSGKIKIAVDTSSLIYLYKSDLLDRSGLACRFITSAEVWDELLMGKKIKEIQTCAGYIEIVPFVLSSDKWGKSAFSTADKSVVEIYFQSDCAAVLSEDGHILRFCKRNDIPHYCALSLLPQLAKQGFLTKEEANNRFYDLVRIGRYSSRVVEYATSILNSEVQA